MILTGLHLSSGVWRTIISRLILGITITPHKQRFSNQNRNMKICSIKVYRETKLLSSEQKEKYVIEKI